MITPAPDRRLRPSLLLVTGIASLALVLPACSSSSEEPSAADSSETDASTGADTGAETETDTGTVADECAVVDAPVESIPAQSPAEPVLAIPTPANWTRETSQDGPVVRYAQANAGLSANSFAPNAVVTLDVLAAGVEPEAVFETSRTQLTEGGAGTNLTYETTTVCGLPAETLEYTCAAAGAAPERPCSAVSVVYPGDANTYLASVVIQTTDDADPTYQADKQTIVDGFQVLPPAA